MKVLLGVEDEIVERIEGKSAAEMEVAGRVKDGIREFAIKEIVFVL
jgi:hypothetical protein